MQKVNKKQNFISSSCMWRTKITRKQTNLSISMNKTTNKFYFKMFFLLQQKVLRAEHLSYNSKNEENSILSFVQ